MEMAVNVVLSLVLALVVVVLLVLILGQSKTFTRGLGLYLPLAFTFVLTAGLWSHSAVGQTPLTVWLAPPVAGLIALLTTLLFRSSRTGPWLTLLESEAGEVQTPEMGAHLRPLRHPAALREYYYGTLFWLVVIGVLAGVVVMMMRR